MEFFIGLVVGVVVGGAAVWFFKAKALKALEEAKQELEEKFADFKDKVKKD
jgi:uncharacterized membrane-anchored protein YhcB (DUF1043 family)